MENYSVKDTFLALIKSGGKTNYFAFFLSSALTLFIFIREYDTAGLQGDISDNLKLYLDYFVVYWVFAYCGIVYSLAVPLLRIRKKPFGKAIMGWSIFFFIVIAIALSFLALLRLKIQADEKIIHIVGPLVAAIIAITGWFVQHQLVSYNSRNGHSLNILLQMRISEEFQRHTRIVNQCYPNRLTKVIPEDDARIFHESDFENSDVEVRKRMKAISSQYYLLNYYEFLAVGIEYSSLDEELLYQTLGGIIIRQYSRSEHLINYTLSNASPKTFENLRELVERWKPRHDYESQQLRQASSRM